MFKTSVHLFFLSASRIVIQYGLHRCIAPLSSEVRLVVGALALQTVTDTLILHCSASVLGGLFIFIAGSVIIMNSPTRIWSNVMITITPLDRTFYAISVSSLSERFFSIHPLSPSVLRWEFIVLPKIVCSGIWQVAFTTSGISVTDVLSPCAVWSVVY